MGRNLQQCTRITNAYTINLVILFSGYQIRHIENSPLLCLYLDLSVSLSLSLHLSFSFHFHDSCVHPAIELYDVFTKPSSNIFFTKTWTTNALKKFIPSVILRSFFFYPFSPPYNSLPASTN